MNTSGQHAPAKGAAGKAPRDAPTKVGGPKLGDPKLGDTAAAGAEASGTADAWAIVSYQMAGMTVWGGIGWLLDRWTGHTALFLPIGVIVGIVGAIYLIFARFYRS